jgi:hypothetical protein
MLHADAKSADLVRRVDEMTGSVSWRLTAPLRRLNALRNGRRAR